MHHSVETSDTPAEALRWPVIDTHFHVGVNPYATFIAEEELIPYLDDNGIDCQLVFQVNEGFHHRTPDWNPYVGNDYIAKVQALYPERVIGLAHVNPWLQAPVTYGFGSVREGQPASHLVNGSPAIEEVERAIGELGLNGLKFHPFEHGYAFNDLHIMCPVLDKLVEMQERTGRRMVIVVHAGGESIYNSPSAIAETARRYPQLLFLAAHAGFIWGTWTLDSSLGELDNVMFDLTCMPQKSIVWEAFQRRGAERFTAGGDCPFASVKVKNEVVKDLTDDAEERELILGGNLAKLLGIPKVARAEAV